MDGRRFRSLCANVDGLTVEQLRALRRIGGSRSTQRRVVSHFVV